MSSPSEPQPHTDAAAAGHPAEVQQATGQDLKQQQQQLSEEDMSLFSLDRPRDCISGTREVTDTAAHAWEFYTVFLNGWSVSRARVISSRVL
jgi:hypothetical protein